MSIIGVGLHTRQQTIAMLDTDTGERVEKTLERDGKQVWEFYAALRRERVLVGIEVSESRPWFLKLMEELRIECRVGDPQKLRKSGDLQAETRSPYQRLLPNLLVENRFSAFWTPSNGQRDLRTLGKRKRVEQSFGWMKMVGMLRKVKLRGIEKVGWLFIFTGATYNLSRLRNLMARA
jgi:hypothetical protein